jgi:16S rRNA processing protein RimM
MSRRVLVGVVVRAHGVRGEVVVRRFGDDSSILEKGAVLQGERGSLKVSLEVFSARPYKREWLVVFQGVEDRDEAETLAGMELSVDSSRLPALPEGTYYSYQLEGLSVVTVAGEDLGVIEEVLETGANDVAVLRGPRGEVLLPLVEHVIREVSLEEGRMTVEPIPGLIPENETGESRKDSGS